ncbi:MAG: DUF4407 domain-containing protein [Acidobacteria bacterium]|nr:DUF4407 domain-containing protein [Acidobacteriota bacterium]
MPRVILAVLIWATVGEAMFTFAMKGEIDRAIAEKTKIAVNDTRSGSVYEAERSELAGKIKKSEDDLVTLKDEVQKAERELDAEMGGVKVEGRTTGIEGKGPQAKLKAELLENARRRLAEQGAQLQNSIDELTIRLNDVKSKIDTAANARETIEAAANGPETRHRIMLELVFANPFSAIGFLLIALVLLIIDTLWLYLKFSAKECEYDRLLRRHDDRLKTKDERFEAVITSVKSGNQEKLRGQEKTLADAIANSYVRELNNEMFASNEHSNGTADRTRIKIEAPEFTADQFEVFLTEKETFTVTLDDLMSEIEIFLEDVKEQKRVNVEIREARNSDGELIERFIVPLLDQLNRDRRVLLRLTELDTAKAGTDEQESESGNAHEHQQRAQTSKSKVAEPETQHTDSQSNGSSPKVTSRLIAEKLQQLVAAYIYLFPGLPEPTIRMRSKADHPDHSGANGFASGSDLITIFEEFFIETCKSDFASPHLHRFIKHELVHNWICFKEIVDDHDHGEQFQYWDLMVRGGLPKFRGRFDYAQRGL